jgi:hypothetical protein
LIEEKKVEELWEELNMHLQKGIPDIDALHRAYNALTKFMSVSMVVMGNISDKLSVDEQSADDYHKTTREMIVQNYHYNERRMLRHLRLPKEQKTLVSYRDTLVGRLEQCKEVQRILRDRLEAFKFEFNLSGGNQ